MAGLDDEVAGDAGQHDPDGDADLPVDERLARLLGPGPRHADSIDAAGDWPPDGVRRSVLPNGAGLRGGLLRRAWEERFGTWAFGRSQVIVILVIVVLGMGLAGWSLLRARPVALASGGGSGGGGIGVGTVAPSPDPPATVATGPAVSSATGSTDGSAASPGPPMIKVDVMGAVKRPGVKELPQGARVDDALHSAGGLKKSAELGDLNLAQPLADGQQVFVARSGRHSEVRDPVTASVGGSPGDGSADGYGSASGGGGPTALTPQGINLNTATTGQLDQLPGVGPVIAQKIITWRDQHGRFTSVEELQEVDGIGPKTYADLAPLVTV